MSMPNDRAMGLSGRVVAISAALITAFATGVSAQSYRQEVRVPPIDVYRSMLGFSEKGDVQRLNGSLPILQPILTHIEQRFRISPVQRIQRAIKAEDRAEMVAAVEELIIWDIKDLLDQSLENLERSLDEARTPIKTARFTYDLLSPNVRKKDPDADARIRKAFDSLFLSLNQQAAGTSPGQQASPMMARSLTVIVFELTRVFPQ